MLEAAIRFRAPFFTACAKTFNWGTSNLGKPEVDWQDDIKLHLSTSELQRPDLSIKL
jgi:hypothetical protein